MSNQSIFITGTDTGIGKTTITAALLLALQRQKQSVGVLKPIETGVDNEYLDHSDTERLRSLLSLPFIRFGLSVCIFSASGPIGGCTQSKYHDHPLTNSFTCCNTQKHYSYLLIEGAGGIFTPIAPQYTMRDFIQFSQIPCLIVGHTDLGGVNHCLLTLHALEQAEIKVLGIVLNEYHSQNNTPILQEQHDSTTELIREESSVPVFGPIKFSQTIETNWQEGVTKISGDSEIHRLAKHLSETEQETE